MPNRSLVRNAADPKQVKRAERKAREAREKYLLALQTVLQTYEGRRVFWELLSTAGVFRSIWHPSAEIHYNAGRQDFGHELMADCIEADEVSFAQMQQDARDRTRQENRETDAAFAESGGRAVTEES